MSLPLVFEVAVGLVFIYLTLSLLASEVQEIIGTLLQWRAEHLKRSIEVLIAGNDPESKAAAQAFADRLYNRPLIRSLNQEAAGPLCRFLRLINQAIGVTYRTVTQTRNVFGKSTSGPSYIPPESFSQALLESLQIEDLRKVLLESRLLRFVEEKLLAPLNHMVNDLRASTANEFLLSAEFRDLEQSIEQLIKDFQAKRTTLSEAIDRLIARLDDFAVKAQDVLPDNHHLTETFMRRLKYLKGALASTTLDKSALLKTIQPTLSELLSVLDSKSKTYRELKMLVARDGGAAKTVLAAIESQSLPASLRASLVSLADRASSALATTAGKALIEAGRDAAEEPISSLKLYLADAEGDVKAFGQEVESWFNRGMDRASGVYRRNAKGVALLLGVTIAIAVNADSFYMLERLAQDPIVRTLVNQSAQQLAASPATTTVDQLQEEVDQLIEVSPIPLGYTAAVMEEQAESEWFVPLLPRRVVGWLVTGFAIAMGSNFWFGILKRVVTVKATGKEVNPR